MKTFFPVQPPNAVAALDGLLEHAAIGHASDVHIDPQQDNTFVRLRIDGLIKEAGVLPKRLHEEVIARLKILSGARTDIHMLPQDGRWRTNIGGADYNARVSFMPTYHGENAVIRLLPVNTTENITFAGLGFSPEHVHKINAALKHPNGLILVTGPTGSGKTTTLHACLKIKTREPLSIITLEDPVEYEIQGVRQVHINHTYGVSFAGGLRSALRQDPDVIMVGEVRDKETAQVCIHTALTGHLVFSTLHTNSALQAITRLVDMGIDHYLLSSTLRLIIAQRLVRNVCHECYGIGCSHCRQTGYNGRSVINEVCEVDPGLADLISKKEPISVLEEYARTKGFRPLLEDGLEKVEWGVTTREEVMRVLYE